MSNSTMPPMIEELRDDDQIVVLRFRKDSPRRIPMLTSGKTLKTTLLASVAAIPGAQGPVGPVGPAGPPGRDGADGGVGPMGLRGPGGQDGVAGLTGRDGAKGEAGLQGATGASGPAGKDGLGAIPERFTGTVAGSAGLATISFGKTFKTVYPGHVVTTWVGSQMVTGTVTETTLTGAKVKVMISVATLLLNASPFGIAPAGTPVTIEVPGF